VTIDKHYLAEVERRFPKLRHGEYLGKEALVGCIDVSDAKGNFLEEFEVALLIPKNYPYGVPDFFETSQKLPRGEEDHINAIGLCCVEMDLDLMVQARRGIRLCDFLTMKVYPFLLSVLHKMSEGTYPGGDYAHGTEGRLQRYRQKLETSDDFFVLDALEVALSRRSVGRNDPCWCGSGIKAKRCHLGDLEWLRAIGSTQLRQDLLDIRTRHDELATGPGEG
jgi:hypothetical protein